MNTVADTPRLQGPQVGKRAWTDAQRAEQAAKLHARKIWLKSTGPKTPEGKAISCLNALKHGGTSRPAKAFMAHFRNYHALLRICFQKKRELLQIRKNELIDLERQMLGGLRFHKGVAPQNRSGKGNMPPFPSPQPPPATL